MLSIKDVKINKATIKVFCRVIFMVEKRDMPNNENRAINLKKYKNREMLESSAIITGENAKYGTKRRKASQLRENKNNSKKNISVDCIFLNAKYV